MISFTASTVHMSRSQFQARALSVSLVACAALIATGCGSEGYLKAVDTSGHVIHFDKSTGAVLGRITISTAPSTTWTMAVDANGDFVVNYWGQQRIFSHVDGSAVKTWDAASYYPGSSGYYWYVTF